MIQLVGGTRIHAIGVVAHTAIYTTLMLALLPAPWHGATWVLCVGVSAVLAWFWPITDYVLTAALAIVSVVSAVCLVTAVLCLCWLACRLTEKE